MVIERFDSTPFMQWLLGSGWEVAGLFQPAPFILLLALLVGGFFGLAFLLRKESARPAKITGRCIAGGLLGGVVPLCIVWLLETLEKYLVETQQKDIRDIVILEKIGKALERPFGIGWLEGGLYHWIAVLAILALVVLLGGWFVAAIRRGPIVAMRITDRVLTDAVTDLAKISPQRIAALSWLSVKESIRHRIVLVVLIIVILVLLFAGLFLDPDNAHPAKLFLSFALMVTGWPVLLFVTLLSPWSIPTDIENKTIHTIVTKPVRASEIVLGRMIGFTVMATGLLLVIGTINYGFVYRGLAHRHDLDPRDVKAAEAAWNKQLEAGEPLTPRKVRTTAPLGVRAGDHRHEVYLNPKAPASDKKGTTLTLPNGGNIGSTIENDHWHAISCSLSAKKDAGIFQTDLAGRSGSPRDLLVARVPVYGDLQFISQAGDKVQRGVNVGDEWTYRSFIRGDSLAAMIWTFQDVDEAHFPKSRSPEGIPLDLTIEVFRTHKGDTSDPNKIRGIDGSLSILVPQSKRMELVRQGRLGPSETAVDVRIFEAKDFRVDRQYIPYVIETRGGQKLDLLKDLIADGQLRIQIRCENSNQYFGAAVADAYLRAADASFAINLIKGYFGIWMRVVLVICVGVMLSTFLSGPVAVFATGGALIAMVHHEFVSRVASSAFGPRMSALGEIVDPTTKPLPGGGPFEAFFRLVTHQNVTSPLEEGWKTSVIEMLDKLIEGMLRGVVEILPDFNTFAFNSYVAGGYDIGETQILKAVCSMIGYVLPIILAGYFFLKTREMAK